MHHLLVQDRLAKSMLLAAVLDGVINAGFYSFEDTCRAKEPLFLELQHLIAESDTFLSDPIALRHAEVVEKDLDGI